MFKSNDQDSKLTLNSCLPITFVFQTSNKNLNTENHKQLETKLTKKTEKKI